MIRPEDEKKINQIVLNLKRSKEIACILLVLFNDELLRQDVETEIKRRLEPDFNFRELRMTEDMYKNVPVIITREMNPQPNDIFLIYDLKKALPEVLEYLNYRREDFVEHKISVIFWLDEPTLIEIMRKALDFFAFRAAPVIEFMVDRSKETDIPGRTTPNDVFIYNSLEELNAKIALREEILKDYLEKRPQDKYTIASLYNELGVLYQNRSDFDKAIEYLRNALKLIDEIKDKRVEATLLGNMGAIYQVKGELDKALEYFLKALEIDRKIGDIQGESNDLSNIGVIYRIKGEYDEALKFHSEALMINQRIGNIQGESINLNNIGLIYQNKNELDKALEFQSKALEINNKIGDILGKASVLGNMGLVYNLKGDLDKALEYYSKTLEINRRIGDILGEARTLGNITGVYRQKGNLIVALQYAKDTFKLFISIGTLIYADMAYTNLQNTISQMKARGIEISQEDAKEIDELTKQYEKMKKSDQL